MEELPAVSAQSLNGPFSSEAPDLHLQCTAAEGTTCQIFDQLSAWNKLLCLAFLQLREMPGTVGRLSLVFYDGPLYGPDRFNGDCSPPVVALATVLVCRLLKSHRCVAHVELDGLHFEMHHELLSSALCENRSVTSLKVACFGPVSGDDRAAAVLLTLPHLQELKCTGYAEYSLALVAGLSTFLRTARSLTTLRVPAACPRGINLEDFFRALSQNCSLEELLLPGRFIEEAPPSARAVFTEWLTNSVSLKRLTVLQEWPGSFSLAAILQGLLGNSSITAVVIEGPRLDQANVQLLSKMFEQNRVLRSFKMLYECENYREVSYFEGWHLDKADCVCCLKALVENHSLEEVALPINIWCEDQWKEFFEALPTKKNLKRVSIEALGRAPVPFVTNLCAALKETGAEEKVSFNSFLSEEDFDEWSECKAFSSLIVLTSDQNGPAVERILKRMPTLSHIREFSLDFDFARAQAGIQPSSLVAFLASTRTLKALSLVASRDVSLYEWQEALMEALALNTSVRELEVQVSGTSNDFSVFSEPLAGIINASTNITTVQYRVGGPYRGEQAFFERLSAGIADNYTLLGVTTLGYTYSKFRRSWIEVLDATNRNNNLLTCAADFARGARRDRRCAVSLEQMQGHPELVEQVARLEAVEPARAAAMVRQGLHCIEGMHDFMRLAGVVRERVTCRSSRDGRMQLDALDEHCWRAVRRYLKLSDVDTTVAETPS